MERFYNIDRDPVDTVVVVSIFREIALCHEFGGKAGVVQNGTHFRVFDGGEAVRQNRETGDAAETADGTDSADTAQ